MSLEPALDPERVGPYRILERLGEGGMGVVYRAEQDGPLRRQVALKMVKLGLDTGSVLARFESERQALARMTSPCIARILDAGATAQGRPYFAMELVAGEPITAFCDRRALPILDRLALFGSVCEGVQHAHNKGIIHRDLKPANVLVMEDEGLPRPKIIDFGIAKAIGATAADGSSTGYGRVGTPEYMSPEQAGSEPYDVDTRSDVFSLGVILYELLAGCRPRAADGGQGLPLRTDVEIPKPSTRLATAPQVGTIAAQRGTDTRSLLRALQGDLDRVVLRALAHEPRQRYASASELAEDLARYRQHEPVLAGPPSTAYRLRKFLRRHRLQAIAVALVGVVMLAGAVASTVGFTRARDNAQRADSSAVAANQRAGEIGRQNVELAAQKATIERTAAALRKRTSEFDMLASSVHMKQAMEREATLHPPWPEKLAGLERFLSEDAKRMRDVLPALRALVDELARRAIPQTEAEIEAERRSHPHFARLQRMVGKVAGLRRARSVLLGMSKVEVPPLPVELAGADARTLCDWGWLRTSENPEVVTHGDELAGVAAAREAVARVDAGDRTLAPHVALCTLAWAWLAIGRSEEAVAAARRAVAVTPRSQLRSYGRLVEQVEQAAASLASDEFGNDLTNDEEEIAQIRWVIESELPRRFPEGAESDGFLFETLHELLGLIDTFVTKLVAEVEERRDWAKRIARLTEAHPRARVTWEAARDSLRAADGEVASHLYRAHPIELVPQVGLVPIGMNPVTKLWEFYDLRSAWGGKDDPAALPIPAHDAHGHIDVGASTGIVFVLLPGGTFTMGAQSKKPQGPNYDPGATSDEMPHPVTLAPFFLARHELTQGQWQRLASSVLDPQPSIYGCGHPNMLGGTVNWTHPVEGVSWQMCEQLLAKEGMCIPTEAQWEYGCRAGKDTPWWTGTEATSLAGAANLADLTAREVGARWGQMLDWLRDGYVLHAPVDTLQPNPWGLHHVIGNVSEWTRDWYVGYRVPARAGDGLKVVAEAQSWTSRTLRGGFFDSAERFARSAKRTFHKPDLRFHNLGVRPARNLVSR